MWPPGPHRVAADDAAEISAAATEQSGSIGQVNNAVTELDCITQQNSALVEQSAAAATSMHEQAGKLAQAVSAIRLNGPIERAALT